jgi:hypothetical protein
MGIPRLSLSGAPIVRSVVFLRTLTRLAIASIDQEMGR